MRGKLIRFADAAVGCVNIEQQMTFDPRIWLVAFMEGFSTLAVEVVAIRLAIPVAGSSMTLTGVMLGVVLFALSAGYWRGGELSSRWDNRRTRSTLTRNLLLAGVIYAAISFPLESLLLEKVLEADIGLGLAIGLTASVLFVLPVYLASQTVPMLAELTNSEGKAGSASGIYTDNGETAFAYVREADTALAAAGSEQVLVIGAAGFTFPRDAAGLPLVKRIDAVDVDPSVLEIAERHFLQRPLPSKVRFL